MIRLSALLPTVARRTNLINTRVPGKPDFGQRGPVTLALTAKLVASKRVPGHRSKGNGLHCAASHTGQSARHFLGLGAGYVSLHHGEGGQ